MNVLLIIVAYKLCVTDIHTRQRIYVLDKSMNEINEWNEHYNIGHVHAVLNNMNE